MFKSIYRYAFDFAKVSFPYFQLLSSVLDFPLKCFHHLLREFPLLSSACNVHKKCLSCKDEYLFRPNDKVT